MLGGSERAVGGNIGDLLERVTNKCIGPMALNEYVLWQYSRLCELWRPLCSAVRQI